ncbi:MAG TPA: hypothetical protein VLB00_17030 [Gemmatimonadales bacterium]|nr:hypothetical protein [Gemmatimonadales bacterium]
MTGGPPPVLLRFGSLLGCFRSSRPLYTEEMALVFGAEILTREGRDPGGERFDLTIDDQPADLAGSAPTAPRNGIWLGGSPGRPVVATPALWAEVFLDADPVRILVRVRQPDLIRQDLHVHFGVVVNKILFLMDHVVLHAAAVRVGDSVHVFVGEKGAGKSTVCLGLARAGGTVLGEDHVILRRAAPGYLVSGGDERSRLTERTERHFFPDSLPVPAKDFAGTPKKEIRMGDFFSSRPYQDFAAHALHFPRVGSRLALRPLRPQVALLRLLQYTSHMQRFASPADQDRFLDFLNGFVETVRTHEIELSPELGDLDHLARALTDA